MRQTKRPAKNEPALTYAPGSAERGGLEAELSRQSRTTQSLALRIGGERIETSRTLRVGSPQRHDLELGRAALAERSHVESAISSALDAHQSWSALDLDARARVFERAAELAAGPYRQRLNAATMLNQGKSVQQAEIDSACELVDFLRFNVHFAREIENQTLISPRREYNRYDFRPLEGFVYAVTPFNFTAIAANLPTAPALLGNTVVWKPSPHAPLAADVICDLLEEAGLPPGVINLVHGDAELVTSVVVENRDFAGLHFTGSTAVLRKLWHQTGEKLDTYRSYPRLVGETGGKGFVFLHPSADVTIAAIAILRGGYEYQGQKCSAASRVYVPRSLWPELEKQLVELLASVSQGDPTDFRHFMGAVIARPAFQRLKGAIDDARSDAGARIVFGGNADDSVGFFIQPTLIEVTDPRHSLMQTELFGPVVTAWVYEDARLDEALELCDRSTSYALTGAILAQDPAARRELAARLRYAAGNLYLNDKPTGAVVGQQPFGGARGSGTNDKAGAPLNLLRWISPRAIKENFAPPRDYRYPHMG